MTTNQPSKSGNRTILYLAIPLIMLLSAKGVYDFLVPFAGPWIAGLTAAAFDMVPLGVVLTNPRRSEITYVLKIAIFSAGIAAIYGTLSGLFIMRPELLIGKPLWLDIGISILHGALIPVLGLTVNWFVFHRASNDRDDSDQADQMSPETKLIIQVLQEQTKALATISNPQQRALPAPGASSGTRIEWPDDVDELLSAMSNKALAEKLQCGVPAVRRLRRRRGIAFQGSTTEGGDQGGDD